MSFFPSKNLTRQSIESIYGPAKKPTPIQKRTSNSSVDRAKTQKRNLEKDTPRLPLSKDASKQPEPERKTQLSKDASKSPEPERKNQPKILQPLLTKTRPDRRVERMRPTEPVKPLPFKPSGCGKGIPPLANLPKPKLGRIPSFILNKKIEAGGVKLKSASLSTLGNKDLKPAIPSATLVNKETPGTPRNAKTTSTSTINNSKTNLCSNKTPDDLFKRNKIPLRKPGSKSTSSLILSKAPPKKEPPALKPKKSVTFEVPPTTASEVKVEKETIPTAPFATYTDESRREYKKYLEKQPVFDDGPLPITEPSKIYLRIKNIGWDYSRFTTTDRTKTQGIIPYDFLNEYLPMFQNNLERAAVHIKYGNVADCTCEQPGPSTAFCEKHIDPTKLQWYEEMTNIMVSVLAFKYELAEYEEAEKMLEEKYPYIYQGWVLKMGGALSMDFRVREARCKSELVNRCKLVLTEEQLLAEYLGSEEKIGQKRNIRLSGRMKQLEQDFETSYMFLFSEYPHLFIQLVEKIEFMPLALERRIVCVRRGQILKTANMDEDKLQEIEESYRRKLEA